jgi:hypothetical protein
MRIYLFVIIGNSHNLEKRIFKSAFLLFIFEKNQTTARLPQTNLPKGRNIKTESQLFPKKCGVKLQKHLKIMQGEQNLLMAIPTKPLE